jgi:nitroreductase
LDPGNRIWAARASALVVLASRINFEYKERPNSAHVFDAGAAWENLALEATRRGLVAHAMKGFDPDRARIELAVPEGFDVLVMIAIGRRGPVEGLTEKHRASEQPSQRRPLAEILFEGAFENPFPGLP